MKTIATTVALIATAVMAQEPPSPDPALVAAELQHALASRQAVIAADAVRRLGRTATGEVVKLLQKKALPHKDPLVQRAALQALRHNPEPEALRALLTANVKKLTADDGTAVEFFLALGQKADKKALPLLTKGLHVSRGSKVVAARIHAIGRIRSPEAVAELMQLLKSGGGGGKRGRGNNPHMSDLRLGLAALTGEDFGNDQTAWIGWWSDHKDRYRLPKTTRLPKQLARKWDVLWADAKAGKDDKGRKRGKDDRNGKGQRGR